MISIELPWPDASLMPNRANGNHWGKTKAARKKSKSLAWALTHNRLAGWIIPDGDISVCVHFVSPDGRHRDLDNLLASMKAHFDGIAQALGVNDRRFCPITISREFGAAPGCVKITIGD